MDDQPWQFDETRASLLSAIEVMNDRIRDVAHAAPPSDRIAQWNDEVARTIGVLEAAKKVILARLGRGTLARCGSDG